MQINKKSYTLYGFSCLRVADFYFHEEMNKWKSLNSIGYALENDNLRMARALIEDATPEQIAAAPASLLYRASTKDDFSMMLDLIKKGARSGEYARHILQPLTYENRNSWQAEEYLKAGMQIDPDDYNALFTCVKNGALTCAELILDQGMDFQQYRVWADRHGASASYPDAMVQLDEHHGGQSQFLRQRLYRQDPK